MNSVMQLFSGVMQTKSLKASPMGTKAVETSFKQLMNDSTKGKTSVETGANENHINQLMKKLKELINDLDIDLNQLFQGIKADKSSGEQALVSFFENMTNLGQSSNKGELFSQLQTMISNVSDMEKITISDDGKDRLLGLLQSLASSSLNLQDNNQINGLVSSQVRNIESLLGAENFNVKDDVIASKVLGDNQGNLEAKMQTLWKQFQQLSNNLVSGEQSLKNINPSDLDVKSVLAIKNLLKDFTKLTSRLPLENAEQLKQIVTQVTKQGSQQHQQLFDNLLNNYRNRQNIPQSYHQQSPVSGKDIAKWVAQSLTNQTNIVQEQNNTQQVSSGQYTSMPMSKVEQLVIHVNQNQSQSSMQKQLIQEFERILKSSNFFNNKAGNMEMQLRLRPSHLGDMSVKLAQINGELTVKIMVSTLAAKEMLESNMGQLRHMFSPQQVIIEKNEQLATQQQFFHESDLEDGESQGQRKDHSSHEEEHQDDDDNNDELSFHEILMNEKV